MASSGNGVVTIHLPRAVDLTESVSLAGVGHYRAAAIFPLGKATAHAGPVIVFSVAGAFAGRSRLGYVGDHGKTRLPAGDYRVYLASDQPMTLRWSVLGSLGTSSYRAHPSRFQVRFTTARPKASQLPWNTYQTTQGFNRTKGLTLVTSRYEVAGTIGPANDEFDLCVAQRNQSGCFGGSFTTTTVDEGDHRWIVATGMILEQDFAPFTGPANTKATFKGTGVDHATSASLLTVEFPG